jgi:hypothetical protein
MKTPQIPLLLLLLLKERVLAKGITEEEKGNGHESRPYFSLKLIPNSHYVGPQGLKVV